ncbi:pentatricopeptide repeat-containing protein At5g39710-like [Pistacia vera]|uniref:pentatricopeptide repeat-containing protein At5g39710-like n=1 Tax=Pistacia vera TaxID=55513 RepID=UPI001262B98F|nr:pentatricopeptide repeat-containing protein At5g39710-like [Pistacia vera]
MVAIGCKPTVITYGTLIDGLCKTRNLSVAIKLYEEMAKGNEESGVSCRPNVVTYNIIIDGLCKAGLVEKARQLFLELMMQRGVDPDIYTYSILMNSYCLVDRIIDARELFDSITRNGYRPDVVCYTKVKDARNLVGVMQLNGAFPNSWTYSIFIDGLCKNGCVLEAVEMFYTLVDNKFAIDLTSLNSLIDGLCKTGRFETALGLFQKFSLHGNLLPDVVTYSILINGLCKNGQLEKANELLSYMEEKGCAPNVVTFNTLMFGFLKNNKIPKVVELLHKMAERNVKPSECTMSLVMQLLIKAGNYRECLNQLPKFMVQKQN